jgi:hypothetical protein
MGRAALSFLAGLGSGALAGYQRQQDMERQAKIDQRAQEEHDARMREQQQKEQDRIALATAARPAQVDVGAGGFTKPDTMDNRDVGQPGEPGAEAGGLVLGSLVNGKPYGDTAAAQQAAADYNAPDARRQRQADALDASGKPTEAIALQNATMTQASAKRKEADEAWRRKIGSAMQAGHEGLADLVTSTDVGPLAGKKAKAVVSPDGKTVNYNIVGEDGTLTPTQYTFQNNMEGVITAGHLLDRTITPEHRMEGLRKDKELERKTVRDDNTFQYQQGLLDTKIKQLELTGQIAEAKALAAAAKSTAKGDPLAKEERLRYTSLLNNAARAEENARKQLASLQGNPLYSVAKPGSPQAIELEGLRENLKSAQDERKVYAGLLAGPKGEAAPALSDAKPGAAAAKVLPMPKTKAELKANNTYQTSRGPAVWNGSAFEQ